MNIRHGAAMAATMALAAFLGACNSHEKNESNPEIIQEPVALEPGLLVSYRGETNPYQKELLLADSSFAGDVAQAAPAARAAVWASWFSADGQQVITGTVVQGKDKIQALMDPAFQSPGYQLIWNPDTVEASGDGTAGWTSGRFVSHQGLDPEKKTVEGRYVTIWKKEEGQWKVSLDTGVPD